MHKWLTFLFLTDRQGRTITGQLKIVFDRLFAWFNKVGFENGKKKSVLLMTARGDDYSMALDFYGILNKYLGWDNLGAILGADREDGFEVVSGPRTTGDGYYESCIVGIEGNQIEITI